MPWNILQPLHQWLSWLPLYLYLVWRLILKLVQRSKSMQNIGHICAKLFFSLSKSSREKTKFSSLIYFSDLLIIVHFVGEVSICAPYLICSAEPTWDYAVFAESPLFMSSKNTSNIWWMAPMKPCGLQISYNVIPFLVWFPSMTLCKEQSATFSKTQCQGSNNMKVGGKNTHRLEQRDPKNDPELSTKCGRTYGNRKAAYNTLWRHNIWATWHFSFSLKSSKFFTLHYCCRYPVIMPDTVPLGLQEN